MTLDLAMLGLVCLAGGRWIWRCWGWCVWLADSDLWSDPQPTNPIDDMRGLMEETIRPMPPRDPIWYDTYIDELVATGWDLGAISGDVIIEYRSTDPPEQPRSQIWFRTDTAELWHWGDDGRRTRIASGTGTTSDASDGGSDVIEDLLAYTAEQLYAELDDTRPFHRLATWEDRADQLLDHTGQLQ